MIYIAAVIGLLIFIYMNRNVHNRRYRQQLRRRERLDKLIDTINEIKKKDVQ